MGKIAKCPSRVTKKSGRSCFMKNLNKLRHHPFLGASPDGLLGEDGLIEVKCLYSIEEKLQMCTKKAVCFKINADGNISLKKDHIYYYQIQGQLNVTEREYCHFIIYTKQDFHVETIYRDKDLWEKTMVPKLEAFYKSCVLPEIVDGRVPRGMKIRDPCNDKLLEGNL